MVKIAIKSEKLTPFGGIFSIMEQFILRAIKELTQENIHTQQIQARTTIFMSCSEPVVMGVNHLFRERGRNVIPAVHIQS